MAEPKQLQQPHTGELMSKGALGYLRGCSESIFPFLPCFYTLHIQKIHGQYLPCLHLREIIHQSHLAPASEMLIFLRVSYCNVPTADGSRLKMCTLCHFWWVFFFPLAEYSISAAAIAIFSVGFAIIGTICVLLSFRKKRDYLLKPASMFYTFAGTRRAAHISALGSQENTQKLQIDPEGTEIFLKMPLKHFLPGHRLQVSVWCEKILFSSWSVFSPTPFKIIFTPF